MGIHKLLPTKKSLALKAAPLQTSKPALLSSKSPIFRAMSMLILFDIDGTILRVNRQVMRKVLGEAVVAAGLSLPDFSTITFAGRTDLSIFPEMCGTDDPNIIERVKQNYLSAFEDQLKPAHVTLLDHVKDLLDFCARHGIYLGLLTGNFKESAYIKLSRVGVDSHFTTGAFGGDHANRNYLPEQAHKLAEINFDRVFAKNSIVIVGDTPNDIACARYYGVKSVAVSTGPFSEEQLAPHKPDLLLSNLGNCEEWIDRLS